MAYTFTLKIGEKKYAIEIAEKQRAHLEVKVNGYVFEFPPRRIRNAVKKAIKRYPLDKSNPTVREVTAPMPGIMGNVFVPAGVNVDKNQLLCILFSMKMENEIRAPYAGKIIKVVAEEKQRVNKGDVLFVMES